MPNVAHSSLTGADLHESKGTAAATSGQVFVADGAGSGSYSKLTAASLQTTGNPFGSQLLHVREEQNNNVGSTASVTVNTWSPLVLNTSKTNEISGASLASNQVTLPAGTYHCRFQIPLKLPAVNTSFKIRLRNTTNSTTLIYSPTWNFAGGGSVTGSSSNGSEGRFTLVGTSVLELQMYENGANGFYLGQSGSFMAGATEREVFSEILFWKIA